jgi:hypothetical protein
LDKKENYDASDKGTEETLIELPSGSNTTDILDPSHGGLRHLSELKIKRSNDTYQLYLDNSQVFVDFFMEALELLQKQKSMQDEIAHYFKKQRSGFNPYRFLLSHLVMGLTLMILSMRVLSYVCEKKENYKKLPVSAKEQES